MDKTKEIVFLKQYIIKGYAVNEKRMKALQKTVEIQTRMLADSLELEQRDVLAAVNQYTQALLLLDQSAYILFQIIRRKRGGRYDREGKKRFLHRVQEGNRVPFAEEGHH